MNEDLDSVERVVPEVTAAHLAWWAAAHRVFEGGDSEQLEALREMARRMRRDVELLERQLGAPASEPGRLEKAAGEEG